MADRKGKARAWSAKRALSAMIYDPGVSYSEVQQRHLAKAYLCGYAAALNGDGSATTYASEWMRLGMSPQAKRKGKSGEGRTNA